MIKYTSSRQISIEEFKTPFRLGLDKNNRWALLANRLPWDDLVKTYAKAMREDFGRPAISPRIVIGSIIIKHRKRLSDEETIEEIRENPYLQYFLGYEEFSHKTAFDPSLFVAIRKRLGEEAFNQMSQALIWQSEEVAKRHTKKGKISLSRKRGDHSGKGDVIDKVRDKKENSPKSEDKSAEQEKRGSLILDAVVAPADIKYPTDLDLLNESRIKSEELIDALYKPGSCKVKPRSYRQRAKGEYLALVKRKKKGIKLLRQGIRKQLGYVRRNIRTIHRLLDEYRELPLSYRQLRTLWIIQEIYRQQREMYDKKSHRISDRLVSISQPHIRPIVRGKAGKEVEFGAQVSASYIDGYVFVDTISWDAVHEGLDLVYQVENYRERFGCYPEAVIADQKYGTRDNRRYLKSKRIRYIGKALGRPPKEMTELDKRARKKLKQLLRSRVKIEGKFGQGKRGYDLGLVKAKLPATSASWIGSVFFMMNLLYWFRENIFVFFTKWLDLSKYWIEVLNNQSTNMVELIQT